ncbi:hypothetical protein, partial [Luteimonas salinisoli]|uniref:hypothetical protein n=1 Tax=Luteimonas salinisoli TaxID=2752307 RepID=UPI001C5C9298
FRRVARHASRPRAMSADGSLGGPGTRPEPPEPPDPPAREADAAARRSGTRRAALRRLEMRGHDELAALSTDAAAVRPAPLQACVDWDLALCPVPSPGLASGD